MSMPIAETPILYGKDSDRFLRQVKENESKKVSKEGYEHAKKIYETIMENSIWH